MKTYGIIMAGGGGTRFWPLSRQKTPKQLLNLTGNDIMINETIKRIHRFIDLDNIFIVTNVDQADSMRQVTAVYISADHILEEPCARNTAACIGYAAEEILQKYGDGVMCIFPADHYIKDEEGFSKVLQSAIDAASNSDQLITVGINPTFPSTGYGYIKYKKTADLIKEVEEFVEKPNYETALSYIESGNYVWNSGMFIWKASVIMKNFERYLPRVYECLEEIGASMNTPNEKEIINSIYPVIPKISIDYGIMERSDNVAVLEGDFGWNDVGSWETLDALYETDENNNIIIGEQINIDTTDCISYSQNRLIGTIGVSNLVIVETSDSILVCSKDRAQDVKKIVDTLNEQNKTQYL